MQTSSNMSDQTYAKDDRYFHSLNAILQSTVRTLKETLNKLLFNMNMYTSSNMFDQTLANLNTFFKIKKIIL